MQKAIASGEFRVCYACGSDKTYTVNYFYNRNGKKLKRKSPNFLWYANPPIGWLCSRCNTNIILNPKWRKQNNARRMWFREYASSVMLNRNPRIGVCNLCRAVIGEINAQINKICKKTDMHHEQYHLDNPEKSTIELCSSCHKRGDNK